MAEKKRIVAIIQARMGSSRLPGKVMADIAGQPMLVRVVERTLRARILDAVVVATTVDSLDDAIMELCQSRGYTVFRGSVFDVLDRYYQAAKYYQAEVVVRLTADSPLIDPCLIEQTVSTFLSASPAVDYASNRIVRTYPIGLDTEVFSFNALARTWSEADDDYYREHVTPYMYEPGTPCSILSVESDEPLGHYRWTVDTPEDLKLIRHIYRHFDGHDNFTWGDVVDLMRRKPELVAINAGVKQKQYRETDNRNGMSNK